MNDVSLPPLAGQAAGASLEDFPSATSAFVAPSFQQQHNRQSEHGEDTRNRRTSNASTSQHGINNTLPTPTSSTSLLFGGTNVLEDVQSSGNNSGSQAQRQGSGRSASHTSHSQSPAFGSQHQQGGNALALDNGNTQQNQRGTPHSVNNLHLQAQSHDTNVQHQQPQTMGEQQNQQQRAWNPFDILSQAYDFQYPPPSNNSNNMNNTLASLRLFATTADAQFGRPSTSANNGNNNSNNGFNGLNGTGLSGMSLLNGGNGANFGSAGSENGTNSDIDGNALE